jgi:broad specificity phosphatase PhoE
MRTQVIYFIRHGETELNARGIRQGPDGPLSAKGVAQVIEAAKQFPTKKGKPKALIASPFQRTRETAEILAKALDMKIEYCDLLVERRNPTEIIGHSGAERETKSIVDRIDKSFHDDNLRYSDEENFIDLKERAKKLLKYIANRPENQIIMVTHGIFLHMVVSYMLQGEKLTASEYNKLSYINPMGNAGLTICTRTKRLFRKEKWSLIVWNGIPQEEIKEDEEN